MRLLLPALIPLLFTACGQREPMNPRAYLEAVELAGTAPLEAAERCAQTGPAAPECLAQTASHAAAADPELAQGICLTIDNIVWRDECVFMVVEAIARARGPAIAAPRCADAGQFAAPCLMHLWKNHAVALLEDGAIGTSATTYAASLVWAEGVLSLDDHLRARFWGAFFDAARAADASATWDMAWCGSLQEDSRTSCLHALPGLFQRALNRAERKASAASRRRPELCDDPLSAQQFVERDAAIRYTSSRSLDAIAETYRARRCKSLRSPP